MGPPSTHRVCAAALAAVLVLLGAPCARRQSARNCSGSAAALRTGGVLTVGIDLGYPPFALEDPKTGDPSGFEIELASAVARELRLKLLVVNRTAAALIPGVLAHRHDLAASALRDTDDLVRQTCASIGYLDADLGVLVRTDDRLGIEAPADLEGRAVGVLRGGAAERWAQERFGSSASVTHYGAPEDLLDGVRAGTVDAAVDDLPVARYEAARSDDVRVVAQVETHSSYVFAAAPDNGALVRRVDRALRHLAAKGELRRLRAKWFPSR